MKPLQIGTISLPGSVVFGPMAGVSDLPFRLLCHEQGAALGVTELISAKAIVYRNRNTYAMLETHPDEGPVSIQLFGSEPAVFAEAIGRMEEIAVPCQTQTSEEDDGGCAGHGVRYDVLDVNMGCPVPKVTSNGEGSALMKNPRLIEEIVKACVTAQKDVCGTRDAGEDERGEARPVTVKLRAGFDPAHVNAVECALAAEAGGASAVAIHARTRDQMYGGQADRDVIRAVKEAVRIPVIGNGDVRNGANAVRMMAETGCDGVMVARAAQGNPWVFREITHFLETEESLPRPEVSEICAMVKRHFDLLVQYKGAYTAVREMRKHIGWYTAGLPGASAMRDQVNRTDTREALIALCDSFFSGIPQS